jgi:hypothetical protein
MARFQFTIRPLFFAMLLVAILGSWIAHIRMQYSAQMSLANEIGHFGGKYSTSAESNRWLELILEHDINQRVVAVVLSDDCIRPDIIKRMGQLFAIEDFNANNVKISDDDLRWVPSATNLHVISLGGSLVTDRSMEIIVKNPGLKEVSLHDTAITDEGLKVLASLPNIISFDLMDTRVSDKGLIYLRSFSHLQILMVGGDQITDEGVDSIGNLSSLRELVLWRTRISAKGREKLQKLLPNTLIRGSDEDEGN